MGGSFKPMIVGYFYCGGSGLHLARRFHNATYINKIHIPLNLISFSSETWIPLCKGCVAMLRMFFLDIEDLCYIQPVRHKMVID